MEASKSLRAYRNCTELLEKHLTRPGLYLQPGNHANYYQDSARNDSTGTNLLALPELEP